MQHDLKHLMSVDFSSLLFGVAQFSMRADAETRLPPFLGSTLRGSLGHALRKISCLPLYGNPQTCILRERCAYAYCFETPLPRESDVLRGLQYIPHPLVLEPPEEHSSDVWGRGEELKFRLILIGRAIELFPYFVAAADRMAKVGLGKDRGRFHLCEVRDIAAGMQGNQIDENGGRVLWSTTKGNIEPLSSHTLSSNNSKSCINKIGISFQTPLRLVLKGRLQTAVTF